MRIATTAPYKDLLNEIETQKRQLGERAASFPQSGEDYRRLPPDERMTVAKNVLAAYAPIYRRGENKSNTPAPASIIADDEPGKVLQGLVGYLKEKEGEPRGHYGGIHVVVSVHDTDTGLDSTRKKLGGIKEGSYVDEAGQTQRGWHAWVYLSKAESSLSSAFGQHLVEFVDVAVGELLDDGLLEQHRQFLGGQAVGAVTEPVAEQR